MSNVIACSVASESSRHRLELDLLQGLLAASEPYPWQPLHPESDAYFGSLEHQAWPGDGPSAAETQPQWHALAGQAQQCWGGDSTALAGTLVAQFGQRLPLALLTALAQQVQLVAQQGGTLADRLAMAVAGVLDQWDMDDLRVVARPMAMAMRDSQGDVAQGVIAATGERDWTTLSDLEQARLGLAIARYAFEILEQQ